MAPSIVTEHESSIDHIVELKESLKASNARHGGNTLPAPLKYSGSLDQYKSFEVSTVIGREFPELQVADLLTAPNSDELIRDLAITISQRGVVFFRNQNLTIQQQKELGQRLGELTGKPATSKLHVHPTTWKSSELGDEISVISSERTRQFRPHYTTRKTILQSKGWHSDITFEVTPSDYALLKVHTVPESGGDTLWSSGYAVYDALSKPYAKFLEGLTAYHAGDQFLRVANAIKKEIRTDRGSPENQGVTLDSVHPVVRTNPVTGWKSVYLSNNFTKYINEVSEDESEQILQWVNRLYSENHGFQARIKWSPNDLAIWDNRSVLHTATTDVIGHRQGDRVVSLGERPFYDPTSISRREALGPTAYGDEGH